MNFMSLLLHAGQILSALKTIESIAAGCIKEKRAPSSADDKALIGVAETLLSSGLITIPDMVQNDVLTGLEAVKAAL